MQAQTLVKEMRDVAHLTQVEIAARTGLPQSTISKIELGTVKDVLSRTYFKLEALHAEVMPKAKKLKKAA